MNNMGKKMTLLLLLVVMFVLIFLTVKYVIIDLIHINQSNKYIEEIAEKNSKNIFSISKIIKYSSAEAVNKGENLQKFNISQFSDFAITIDNHKDIKELTNENTIKELYIDNFKIMLPTQIGKTQNLYYKNPYIMGRYRKLDFNKIENELKYEIIYKNEENEEEYYNKPVFFTDCSNPISFSYINENIFENYSVPKNGSISYDGRVLGDIDLDINEIKPRISFVIHLKNNLNENFVCNVVLDVNFENSTGDSIYSGYYVEILENLKDEYKFLKI